MSRTASIIMATVFVVGLFGQSGAQEQPTAYSLWDLPSLSEEEINIGYWALAIARECDSSIEIDEYLNTLDTMATKIRYMVGPREGDMVRFLMAKMYQFDPGEWNGGQAFSYDLNDPMGDQPGARLLTKYLDTHKGNCVSMPTLFLALMERVAPDVPFNAVSAPLHLFCRLHDRQDSTVWNVETTNGGFSNREQWYVESFGISQTAIDSGTYMRDLTKREFVAHLLGLLISKYRDAGEYEQALKYAELVLELSPRSLTGVIHKGALLGWIGHTLQEKIKLEDRRPNAEERRQLGLYLEESKNYILRARSLGWIPETPESRQKYLRTVREAKTDNSK